MSVSIGIGVGIGAGKAPARGDVAVDAGLPKEPRACCLGANLQTVSGDRHVTVRQPVDGVEFKTAEAELKTKMLGRVGSRRHGERCSSSDGSRDGRLRRRLTLRSFFKMR